MADCLLCKQKAWKRLIEFRTCLVTKQKCPWKKHFILLVSNNNNNNTWFLRIIWEDKANQRGGKRIRRVTHRRCKKAYASKSKTQQSGTHPDESFFLSLSLSSHQVLILLSRLSLLATKFGVCHLEWNEGLLKCWGNSTLSYTIILFDMSESCHQPKGWQMTHSSCKALLTWDGPVFERGHVLHRHAT